MKLKFIQTLSSVKPTMTYRAGETYDVADEKEANALVASKVAKVVAEAPTSQKQEAKTSPEKATKVEATPAEAKPAEKVEAPAAPVAPAK